MKNSARVLAIALLLGPISCARAPHEAQQTAAVAPTQLTGEAYDSGFPQAHDTYNGMCAASDGKIYYVLCSQEIDVAGQMYTYDPATDKTRHVGDLSKVCGEQGKNVVSQGKVHVNFVESNGKLYFATHIGYYTIRDGMETVGAPTPGFKPYQGGHFLSYDMAADKFEDLGMAPHREGIITMAMDKQRRRLYGITWPSGYFLCMNLDTRKVQDLGRISGAGESGRGKDYRTLCRSMTLRPEDGSVFFTTAEGWIFRYDPDENRITKNEDEDLRKDYFGFYDYTSPGTMGYNWRQTFWYAPDKLIYGVHGNSGYLFCFDPAQSRVRVLGRLTSLPSQRSGMFDEFSYGYLGFTLGPDGQTIYYLTGGPIYVNGKRVKGKSRTATGEAKGEENLHLVTYQIPTAKYTDHGPIFLADGQRPTWVNSIAVGKDGAVYTLGRLKRNGRVITDLIKIPVPPAN
jgi:hypothetical protein